MISEENPYTIRVVSEILESNGSSSMATVCAATLSLMDAGVDIIRPVSGIAMGLITNEETNEYAILSDILGDEDHFGIWISKLLELQTELQHAKWILKSKVYPTKFLEKH